MPPLDQLTPEDVDLRDPDPAMPLGDHLDELRRRLLLAIAGVAVALGVTVWYGPRLIAWVSNPLLVAMDATGFPPQTYVTDPTAGFTGVYLPVTLVSAIILASPWVMIQLWQFVAVGLYKHERRVVYVLAPFSTIMTALGVGFTHFILLPVSLLFFLNFAATVYPPATVGTPGPVMAVFLKAYGVEPRNLANDRGPLPDPEQTTPLADLATLGQAQPDPSGPEPDKPDKPEKPDKAGTEGTPREPTSADHADPAAFSLPVRGSVPAEARDGDLWLDASDGKLKVFLRGEIRELATSSRSLVTPLPKLDEFIRFAVFMGLGVVAAFQVPVVMLVAGWTGLLEADVLRGARRYALLGSVVAGAILTPTDIVSMLVLALPLYLLFEFGLVLMRTGERRRARPTDAPSDKDGTFPEASS